MKVQISICIILFFSSCIAFPLSAEEDKEYQNFLFQQEFDRNINEIYRMYKFPLIAPVSQGGNNLPSEKDPKKIEERLREIQWHREQCKSAIINLYTDFLMFLYNDPEIHLYDYCKEIKDKTEESILIGIKAEIFSKIKIRSFIFLESQFPVNELKNIARKCYDLALEKVTHYQNFGIRYLIEPQTNNEIEKWADRIEWMYKPIDKYPANWLNALHNECSTKWTNDDWLSTQFQAANQDRYILPGKQNEIFVKMFKEKVALIETSPRVSSIDKQNLKKTISCFESWPKEHFDYLSLDYYSGFFLDYGRKFEYKDPEKIDPEFSKVLDFYYKSLYQNEIFSMRLGDVLKNCLRLAKIPSNEFSYKKLLEKYYREKKSSSTPE
ncbi:MAG: hypothetical protein L6Q54_05630 [Leptospiraceae bacterium]|nr:hypothetical protein [Leptospiraceae bacterium]MCK6380719.1 hypothetical protein [Leptospiraceae bacterium]NUM41236.1 hypothetical protein [Leptospiraceae bacterium]